MKRPAVLGSLTAAGLLLAPLWAASESQIQVPAAHRAATASAHVNFKVVIPKVLSLAVVGDADAPQRAQSVAIGSNGRTVSLAATAVGSDPASRNLILNAAARRSIVQAAACTPLGGSSRTLCTVSMP